MNNKFYKLLTILNEQKKEKVKVKKTKAKKEKSVAKEDVIIGTAGGEL